MASRSWWVAAIPILSLLVACDTAVVDDRETLTPLHGTITPDLLVSSGGRPGVDPGLVDADESTSWASAGVIDGQTLVLVSDGRSLRIRLAGLLTPIGDECLAALATDSLRFIVSGRDQLTLDATGDGRPDGIQPGYVENVDGDDLGAVMIGLGLAEVDDTTVDVVHRDLYDAEFEAAQDEGVGLWAADACDDN